MTAPGQILDRPLRDGFIEVLRRPYARDLGICLFFLVAAVWVTGGLWIDPAHRALALNADDQALYEWFIAFDARVLFGDFQLVTSRLNAPDGVNLLANTSIVAIGVALSPITVVFGAPVTFALVVTGNLGFTAIAWYLLFRRTLGAHRVAAAIGAGVCGFAPAMVSQSNSHLHMTAQWLVPGMVWCVVRIVRAADPQHPDYVGGARRLLVPALILAGLVAVQLFVGEEVLFLTALTLALVTLGYAVAQPAHAARIAPRFLAAMLLATALGAAALTYPLWVQFKGTQHVPNGPFSPAYFSADLASFTTFSPLSVAGSAENARLSTGSAEYNTFLGWPLLILTAACVGLLWRKALVWALVFAGAVMAWLSLGPQIVVNGERSQQVGLYAMMEGLPVVDGALPMRFAVALVPLIATLLVLAINELMATGTPDRVRLLSFVAVGLALVPIAPKPLPVTERAPVPEFISKGLWRECVPPGGVLVPVPVPTPADPEPMRWAAAANVAFGVPEGFFIGPYAAEGRASVGTYSRPTSHLLKEVARTGQVPAIGVEQRDQARTDLSFWTASCVALAPDAPRREELRTTLEALLGPGRQLGDVWAWKL